MKIEYLTHPFEHVIINDFFNENEIKEVKNEIFKILEFKRLFSSSTDKFKNSARAFNGELLSDRYTFDINEFYQGKSKTNLYVHKIFYPPLSDDLITNSNVCNFLRNLTSTSIIIGIYKDGDSYQPHHDCSVMSLVGHIWKDDTKFSGGELYFPEHDNYTITPEFNKFILFPSYINHGVKKVINIYGDQSASRISITLLSLVAPFKQSIFVTNKKE